MVVMIRELEVEPAILATNINKRISNQNKQLANNWQNVRNSLEREKCASESCIDRGKSKMLEYQEKLKAISGNLVRVGRLQTSPNAAKFNSIPTISIETVSALNQENIFPKNSDISALTNFRRRHSAESYLRSTTSSANKRAEQRRTSSSPNTEYQRRQILQRLRKQSFDSLRKGSIVTLLGSQTRKEREAHPSISEAHLPIRLPPFAVHLPPLYCQHITPLQVRNFEKDEEFTKKANGDDIDWEDIKCCRYLRVPLQRKQTLTVKN